MDYKNIATILNTTIVPNILGEETTIAADLSNIVDLGKKMDELDGDTLKDYTRQFAVGVAKTYFEGKKYESSDLGLYRDSQEFAGAVQRVKMDVLQYESEDTPIFTLENGTDYFDGKYYGPEADTVVYTQEDGFQVKHSVPNEKLKTIFMSAQQVSSFVSLIEQTVSNSIEVKKHGLAKSLICQVINKAYEGSKPRVYHLVTEFNKTVPTARQVTTATAYQSPEFLRWSAMQVSRLPALVSEMSSKYNDGTITEFTPKEDIRMILLDQFDKAITYNMESDVYHNDLTSMPAHATVPFWQNAGDDLIPDMGVTAEVTVKTGESTSATRSNVVGVVMSYYTCGITDKLNKTTVQYIANGDYNTFFHNIVQRYFIDKRNMAVVFALD